MNITMKVPGRKGNYQNAGSEEDFSITCKPCRRDGTEIGAYGYCVDCEEHLCVACYGCHRRTLLTKDHNLLDETEMPLKTVRKIPALRPRQIDTCTEQCPDHENKFIEYYCPLHDKLGCNACITLNHRNCEGVAFIPDIEGKDEKYTKFTEEIKTISKQFQTNMKFAEENINTAKMNHSKLKEERNRFRKEIVANLDRLEQRFDNKISMLRDEDIGAMEYIKGKSDCCTKQLETMLSDVENKYKVGQVCNAFIAVKRAEDEIKTVEEELKRLQEKKEIRKIEFQPAPTLSALVDLKEFGKLSYTKKHLEASAEKKYSDVKDNSNPPLYVDPSSECTTMNTDVVSVKAPSGGTVNSDLKNSQSLYKPLVQRSFSWSTCAKNLKVYQIGRMVIKVYEADILQLPVECIVNAANKDLQHGGGIAYAIAQAAGDDLRRESQMIIEKYGRLKERAVARTTAGHLPYRCVLHAVGPCWFDYMPITVNSLQRVEDDLYQAIFNSLMEVERLMLKSVALTAISSAIFGVPRQICSIQYAEAVKAFCAHQRYIEEVHFVDLDHAMIGRIQSTFNDIIVGNKSARYNRQTYIQNVVRR